MFILYQVRPFFQPWSTLKLPDISCRTGETAPWNSPHFWEGTGQYLKLNPSPASMDIILVLLWLTRHHILACGEITSLSPWTESLRNPTETLQMCSVKSNQVFRKGLWTSERSPPSHCTTDLLPGVLAAKRIPFHPTQAMKDYFKEVIPTR